MHSVKPRSNGGHGRLPNTFHRYDLHTLWTFDVSCMLRRTSILLSESFHLSISATPGKVPDSAGVR